MSDHIRLYRGLDIPLKGEPTARITKTVSPDTVAVKLSDFRLSNPKLLVRQGDEVKAGTPVIADKDRPYIFLSSPISGKVNEIVRAEKRKLKEVVIESDHLYKSVEYPIKDFKNATRKELIDHLLSAGLWAVIKQRPYGIIPDPEAEPKAVFISGFDSSPLAPDVDYTTKNIFDDIQAGVDVLNRLTRGGVHISLHARNFASSPLHRLCNVSMHTFDGQHPVGNVGIQVHHISPVSKGEVVWTLDPHSVAAIGRLFVKGIYNVAKIVAITGPRAVNQSYVETVPGMSFRSISEYADIDRNGCPADKNMQPLPIRYISGNILTGDNVGSDGFLGFFHNQITLVSEGNYNEVFGWAKPFRRHKFSVSPSYFSWLFPKKKYTLDTNLNGGKRSFVMTGVYEKVLPMNIYPVYLLKAILAEDIDKMEALGIYEVIEEDVALCEFVCPSKVDIQEIISNGINLMIKEMS